MIGICYIVEYASIIVSVASYISGHLEAYAKFHSNILVLFEYFINPRTLSVLICIVAYKGSCKILLKLQVRPFVCSIEVFCVFSNFVQQVVICKLTLFI